MATPSKSQLFQAAGAILIVSAALMYAYYSEHPQRAWLIDAGLLATLFLFTGWWVWKLPLGILISERNLMSLSRLQIVGWSVAIFSGYILIAMQRAHHGLDPLNITIDNSLWAVLGISTASLVGTPLVLNGKTTSGPSLTAIRSASLALKEGAADIQQNAVGTLYSNKAPQDARFSDIFQGDEVGNTAYIDVSKVQMFILTVILIGTYCCALWQAFISPDFTKSFLDAKNAAPMPPMSTSMLQLLAVSHAGYLTFKAVGHTDTTNN